MLSIREATILLSSSVVSDSSCSVDSVSDSDTVVSGTCVWGSDAAVVSGTSVSVIGTSVSDSLSKVSFSTSVCNSTSVCDSDSISVCDSTSVCGPDSTSDSSSVWDSASVWDSRTFEVVSSSASVLASSSSASVLGSPSTWRITFTFNVSGKLISLSSAPIDSAWYAISSFNSSNEVTI